jgi:hypothetical protein
MEGRPGRDHQVVHHPAHPRLKVLKTIARGPLAENQRGPGATCLLASFGPNRAGARAGAVAGATSRWSTAERGCTGLVFDRGGAVTRSILGSHTCCTPSGGAALATPSMAKGSGLQPADAPVPPVVGVAGLSSWSSASASRSMATGHRPAMGYRPSL